MTPIKIGTYTNRSGRKGYIFLSECASCGTKREVKSGGGLVVAENCSRCTRPKNLKRTIKHGMAGTKLYYTWASILQRTGVRKGIQEHTKKYYSHVGLCPEWESFEAFMAWSMANGFDESKTIDRIDNSGNYCPGNCRWTDIKTQGRNRSNVRLSVGLANSIREEYALGGISQYALARRLGVHQTTISKAITMKHWN